MSILPLFLILLCAGNVSTMLAMPRSSRYGIITSFDGPDEAMLVERKRYDRNCFFSPVQCMLTYNDDTRLPLVVTRKASGRKRFDPFN